MMKIGDIVILILPEMMNDFFKIIVLLFIFTFTRHIGFGILLA